MGAENSKHFGRLPGIERGTTYFYDCCDAEECGAQGCTVGFHVGYGDEEEDEEEDEEGEEKG